MKNSLTLGTFTFATLITGGLVNSCNNSTEKQSDLPPPNILWINCEDISPNLGCYGDEYATTPNLDKMAEDGVMFTQAYATAPICGPSRSCLISGLYATSLGTQHLFSAIDIPEYVLTIPEYLEEKDYFTAMYGKTGFHFNPDRPETRYDYLHWRDDMAPWRKREGKPFFGYFTLGYTHEGPTMKSKNWAKNIKNLPEEMLHDPAEANVPKILPQTDEFKRIWSHYADNITVLDERVGHILNLLEEDGLMDSTFVFFFSDHGAGLPGYKRWVYSSGIKVPLIIHVPKAYQHLAKFKPGTKTNRLTSFVDYPATVLNLAGLDIPEHFEGIPFMGEKKHEERQYAIGARSRADNVYETIRSINDGRYLFVKNFRPHLPYMQPAHIFDTKEKEGFVEIHRLHDAGKLNPEFERYFHPQPREEFYDMQKDPLEINNLIDAPEHQQKIAELREELKNWMTVKTKDAGLLHEPEFMLRSEGSTVYEMVNNPETFDAIALYEAADKVGIAEADEIKTMLKDKDSGVRYWGILAAQAKSDEGMKIIPELKTLLDDDSPVVQIEAAYTLCQFNETKKALDVLSKWVKDDREWLALHAARSIELIKDKAKPIIPVIKETYNKYSTKSGDSKSEARKKSPYRSAIFFSLQYALKHCGEEVEHTLK